MSHLSDARKEHIRRMRHEPTASEDALWRALRGRDLAGWKFRRQHPLGRYTVDFCCPEARLVVEVDGAVHGEPEQEAHDADRDANLAAEGYRVLRLSAESVEGDLTGVLVRIGEALGPHPPAPSPAARARGST